MSKFDDMITGLQQDIEVPERVWAKYTDTLSNLPDRQEDTFSNFLDKEEERPHHTFSNFSDKEEERSYHTFSKRRMWPVAAAATLALCTISVSAAAYLHWSKGLQESLQVTAEQQKSLEDNQMSSYVGQSVTQGDVTVTAQQCIVDNYFAHLSFKVEGYEVEDGQQPGFSDAIITVGDEEDYTGGWTASFYNGLIPGMDGKAIHADDGTPLTEDEVISYTMEDGSLEFHVEMMSDLKGAFLNKPIHVELKDLGIYGGKAEDVVVEAEGDWTFDWVLPGSDEVKQVELDAPLGDSGATVVQAELSPISVSVTYDFPRQEETEIAVDENGEERVHTTFKEAPSFTGVQLKDGTIYTGISGAGVTGYESEDSEQYRDISALQRVIDVDQVESLLFIKSYPEGEQVLGEDNLYFVPVG